MVPTDPSYTSPRSTTETSIIPKEQYPMLANHERGLNDRESDYTTTWQRRTTSMPGTAIIRDPSVPPPPKVVFDRQSPGDPLSPKLLGHSPLSPPSFMYPDNSNNALISPQDNNAFFKPYHHHVDHVYESPNFKRKNYGSDPVYDDNDDIPERRQGHKGTDSPPDILPDEVTYGRDILEPGVHGHSGGHALPGVHGGQGRHWPPPPPPPPSQVQFFPVLHGTHVS